MMKSIFTAAAFALIAAPSLAQDPAQSEPTIIATDAQTVTAKVKGMVCDFCAQAVTKVFGKRDEVAAVEVDLDTGEILLTMEQGKTLDDETVEKLVRKSGYSLVSIERAGGA